MPLMPALTLPNAVHNFIVEMWCYSVIWAKVTSIHYTIKVAGNEAGWVCIVSYLPKLYSWVSGQHLLDLSPKNCQIQWMNHQDHPKRERRETVVCPPEYVPNSLSTEEYTAACTCTCNILHLTSHEQHYGTGKWCFGA